MMMPAHAAAAPERPGFLNLIHLAMSVAEPSDGSNPANLSEASVDSTLTAASTLTSAGTDTVSSGSLSATANPNLAIGSGGTLNAAPQRIANALIRSMLGDTPLGARATLADPGAAATQASGPASSSEPRPATRQKPGPSLASFGPSSSSLSSSSDTAPAPASAGQPPASALAPPAPAAAPAVNPPTPLSVTAPGVATNIPADLSPSVLSNSGQTPSTATSAQTPATAQALAAATPRFELAFGVRLTPLDAAQPETSAAKAALSSSRTNLASGIRSASSQVAPGSAPAIDQDPDSDPDSESQAAQALVPDVAGAAPDTASSPTGPAQATTDPSVPVPEAAVATLNQTPALESRSASVSSAEPDDSQASSAAAGPAGEKDKAAGHDAPSRDAQPASAAVTASSNSGASPDHSGGFAQPDDARASNAPAGAREASRETPFQTTAEAIRNAEPAESAPPVPQAASAHEIVMRIAQPDAPAVDVHVMQRAGEVQVAVHTPDAALQSSLRQDLGTLVSSLQRAGYHADAFTSRDGAAPKTFAAEANLHDGRRQQQDGSSGRGPAGDSSGKRQNQQRKPGQNSQDWLEELERQS